MHQKKKKKKLNCWVKGGMERLMCDKANVVKRSLSGGHTVWTVCFFQLVCVFEHFYNKRSEALEVTINTQKVKALSFVHRARASSWLPGYLAHGQWLALLGEELWPQQAQRGLSPAEPRSTVKFWHFSDRVLRSRKPLVQPSRSSSPWRHCALPRTPF